MTTRSLILLFVFVTGACKVNAQCPDKNWLYHRLVFLRDSATQIPASQKLAELNRYASLVPGCNFAGDTVHALLLQRLGAAYFATGDHGMAIRHTQQSVDLIHSTYRSSTATDKYLLKNYSNLILYNDSIKDTRAKDRAVDSCIAIAERSAIQNELYLIALVRKVETLFNKGEYTLCLLYANEGETATPQCTKDNTGEYLDNFFSWKINVLIKQKEFDKAEQLLSSRIKNNEETGTGNDQATLYSLLAQAMTENNHPEKALLYFQLALKEDQQSGNDLGCMQTLDNLANTFYSKYKGDHSKALSLFFKALSYGKKSNTDPMVKWEAMNIFSNIAVVYGQMGKYDSALYYFDKSVQQIFPSKSNFLFTNQAIEQILETGDSRYFTEMLLDRGEMFSARYLKNKNENDLAEAIRIFKLADIILEKIKKSHSALASKLLWRRNARRLYDHAN